MDDEYAVAMLVTLEGPIRAQLHILINILGTITRKSSISK
jgi:hypothetical protein